MKNLKVVPKGEPYIMIPLGFGPIYAEKNGRAVLKTEVSWKKLSGIVLNTKWGCVWFQFRRHPSWEK